MQCMRRPDGQLPLHDDDGACRRLGYSETDTTEQRRYTCARRKWRHFL